MINIRLGNHHKEKENVISLIEGLKKHPGCCDEVWFASEYGYPKLETHKKAAEKLVELADLFRKEGIKVSLQISNTVGHGEYMKSCDCTGLVYEGSNVEKMVDADGTVADYAFCWRGENFRKYNVEEMKHYAAVKPDTFWIDDDLRAYNHAPVNYGCYCDDCIKKFNEQYGHALSREEIAYEMSYGDTKIREEYIEFIREGLADFTALITKALIDVSHNSKMGYQSCRCNNYTRLDHNFIFEPMYKISGKAPKYRPGGGYYNDKNPFGMFEKGMILETAIAQTPEYVTDILPEVENTPDVAFGKSIGGTVKEATLYLALGCTSTSFASLMTEYEDISWHENMFKAFAKVRPYWLKLSEISKISKTCGVSIYETDNTYKQKLKEGDDPYKWAKLYYLHGIDLQKIGIPVTNILDNPKAYLITSDMVDYMSREELENLKQKPVVTDAMTIEKISAKGIDLGVTVNMLDKGNYLERLNNVGNKKWIESFFASKGLPTYLISGDNIKPLGPLFDKATNREYGCCNAIVHLKNTKWVVFGYGFWNDIISTDKRNQILFAIDEITNNSLPAMLLSGEQVAVIPKVDNEGKTIAVSLQNISIGNTQELKVVVRNPAGNNFYYMNGEITQTPIQPVIDGEDYIFTLPAINGWDIITLFNE